MEIVEIKDKLRTFICAELLNNPDYPLRDDEPIITSGLMDSFSLAQIGVFAEIEFNVYIPDTDLTVDAMDTLDQMAGQIAKELGT
jgi:acyl carrier protein